MKRLFIGFLVVAVTVAVAAGAGAWPSGASPGPASASGGGAVASGHLHTCALTSLGGVKCWGRNTTGQLGDGTGGHIGDFSAVAVDVVGLDTGVQAVAAGGFDAVFEGHNCALTTAGGVKCWGNNHFGQLGTATADLCADSDGEIRAPCSKTPIDVWGLGSGVVDIAVGTWHSCAVTNAGGVKCWGSNHSGQLGDGTTTDSTTPVDVVGLGAPAIAVSAGKGHTCALVTGGGVKCWGWNQSGQLGDGTGGSTGDFSAIPVGVVGLEGGVVAIAAGSVHTCALTTAGNVKCWGWNAHGQLGDGTTFDSTTPVDVVGLGSGAVAVSGGIFHTCALTTAGGATCWGDNSAGQLGDGTTFDSTIPIGVSGLTSGVVAISAGGSGHTCALAAGGAKCWGSNVMGQLGDGTTTNRLTPVDVLGFGPAPPVGGIVEVRRDTSAPAAQQPGSADPPYAALAGAAAAGALAFTAAAWYARRRWLR